MNKPSKSLRSLFTSSRSNAGSKREPIEITNEMRERIAQKAYELYEQRGREGGREMDDWLQAEAIVLAEARQAGS